MKIAHVAIWTKDLEKMRSFYETYFEAKSAKKFTNYEKAFSSYLLCLAGGIALKIMTQRNITERPSYEFAVRGPSHIAIAIKSKELVDEKMEMFRHHGIDIISEPCYTNDGYYEGIIADPEGNHIVIITSRKIKKPKPKINVYKNYRITPRL